VLGRSVGVAVGGAVGGGGVGVAGATVGVAATVAVAAGVAVAGTGVVMPSVAVLDGCCVGPLVTDTQPMSSDTTKAELPSTLNNVAPLPSYPRIGRDATGSARTPAVRAARWQR
jgi:hypothetical protein